MEELRAIFLFQLETKTEGEVVMQKSVLLIAGVWLLLLIFGCGDDTTSSPDGGGAGEGGGAPVSDAEVGADSGGDGGDDDAGDCSAADGASPWGECAPCAWECVYPNKAVCKDGVHHSEEPCGFEKCVNGPGCKYPPCSSDDDCINNVSELGWDADAPVTCRQQTCNPVRSSD